MTDLSEEYRLSTYKDFGPLEGKDKIRLVRSEMDGAICVKKVLHPESLGIYTFLKEHPSRYFPEVRECVLQDQGDGPAQELVVIEEYIEGKNIAQMAAEHCFDEPETVRIAREICRALKILHHADPPIICRDIKAENIMLTGDGQVRLVDFDIARAYEADKPHDTEVLGTRNYAAPEQFGFAQTDARTDIYALGVLINYMRTGQFPEEEMTGGALRPIVKTCISLDPADRYQSAEELEQALEELPAAGAKADDDAADGRQDGAQPEKNDTRSWMPPGFRTRTPWKIVVAIIGYFLMTAFAFTLEFTDESGVPEPMVVQAAARILIWLSFIGSVFFIWDYRGIRQKVRFLNPENQILRFLSDVVVFVFLFFVAIFASAILVTIFA